MFISEFGNENYPAEAGAAEELGNRVEVCGVG